MNSLKKITEDNYDQDDQMKANEHLVSRVETLEQELAEDMKTKSKKFDHLFCILNILAAR